MDAGVIASVKFLYHRKQIERALDMDDIFETDIYEVDKLQAMRWLRDAWMEMSPEIAANFWRHTKFLTK